MLINPVILWLTMAVNYANTPPPPPRPPVRQQASPQVIAQDQATLNSAQADLDRANQALQAVVDKYRANFEKTEDWTTARSALDSAKADLTAARLHVMSDLGQNSDYTAAVAAEQKAAGDLAMARSSGDAPPDVLGDLAQTSFTDTAAVKKMEDDALAADPTVADARQKAAAAQATADQLNSQFLQSLQDKPDWKAANDPVVEAQKRVSDAQTRLRADNLQ